MNSNAENIIEMIKKVWPKFQITKENLVYPTSELVIRFYTQFLNDLEDNVLSCIDPYYVSLSSLDIEHLEWEEQLFLKINSLLKKIPCMEFKLADIYEPTSVRTKSFFHICCHLIAFSDKIFESVESLASDVFKLKEDNFTLTKKREELLTEIDELATSTSQSMDLVDALKEKMSELQKAYEEMKEKKVNKDKLIIDTKKQLEDLQRQLEEDHELDNLKILDTKLSEQAVTMEEYQRFLTTTENLESELKNLCTDDDNIEDFLVVENTVSSHYQECLKRIPKDVFIKTVTDLCECEEKLQDIEILIDGMSNKIDHLNVLKSQKENRLTDIMECSEKLTNEKHSLETEYNLDKIMREKILCKLKSAIEEQKKFIKLDIEDRIKSTKQVEKVQETFGKEYIRLSEVDVKLKNHYKAELLEIRNII